MDLPSDDEIDRVLMWKKAHVPKDGTLEENLKAVVDKIVSTSLYMYIYNPLLIFAT